MYALKDIQKLVLLKGRDWRDEGLRLVRLHKDHKVKIYQVSHLLDTKLVLVTNRL